MTNLYRVKDDQGAVDTEVFVPSEKVSVSYSSAPLVTGLAASATPVLKLTGTLPTCSELPGLLQQLNPSSPLLATNGGVVGACWAAS
jgi:hypothetical protein